MACQLQREGEEVPFLALINSTPPHSSYTRFQWTPLTTWKFAKNVLVRSFYLLKDHPEKLREFARWKGRALAKRIGLRARPEPGQRSFDAEDWIDFAGYTEEQRRVWEAHLRALADYHPPIYPERVTLFRSPVHLLYCSFDPQYGWGDLAAGGVMVKIIPGAHESIMEEPRVQMLAAEIGRCLREVFGQGGRVEKRIPNIRAS